MDGSCGCEEEEDKECGKGVVSPQGQAALAASPRDVGPEPLMLEKERTESARQGSPRAGSVCITQGCRATKESLCKSREHRAATPGASPGTFPRMSAQRILENPNHQPLLKILAAEVDRLAIMKGK